MKKYFTPKRFLTGVVILSMVLVTFHAMTNDTGAPVDNSHAPYNNEQHCGSSVHGANCHNTSAITSGTLWNNVSFFGDFNGTGGYTPDSTYTMTVKYVHVGKSKFGFQAIPLFDGGDSMGGTVTVTNSNKTRKGTSTQNGQTYEFMTHASSGTASNDSIEWSFDWTAPDHSVGPITFYVVINATNNSGTQVGDQIVAKSFTVGLSNLFSQPSIDADTNIVCFGETLQFYGSGTNSPSSYSWTFPGGNPSTSSSQNPTVTYNTQGNLKAYLKTANGLGFGNQDTFDFTVRPALTAFISGAATRSICEGDSIQITANFVAGQMYEWQNGQTGNIIWAKDTGNYQVTAHRFGCERESNVIRVDFKSKPVAELSSDASAFGDTACINSSLVLQAPSGFDSFYYYNSSGTLLQRSTNNSYTVNFTGATNYGLRVRSASSGCISDLDVYDVHEQARLSAPVVSCDSSTSSSVRYKWTVPYTADGFQVSIDSGANWINPSSGSTGMTHEITGLQPERKTQVWVRAMDDLPCGASAIGKATCFSDTCNSLNFTVNFQDMVCVGEDVEVTINGLKDANFALFFEQGAAITDTIFTFTPDLSKTYLLEIQDSNFLVCPLEEVEIPVTVDSIPSNTVMFDNGGGNYCTGDLVTVTGESMMDMYHFYKNDNLVQSGSNSSYASSDFEYGDSLHIELAKGACYDSGSQQMVPMDSLPLATFTFERFGPNYVLSPNDQALSAYHWDFGDGDSSVEVEPSHNFAGSQLMDVEVILTVTNSNGCENSDTLTISVPDMSSIEQLMAIGLSIYPNPVSDILSIENKSGKNIEYRITDASGKEVYHTTSSGVQHSIITADWVQGAYFIEMTIDGKQLLYKVIKH